MLISVCVCECTAFCEISSRFDYDESKNTSFPARVEMPLVFKAILYELSFFYPDQSKICSISRIIEGLQCDTRGITL